jgi:hypothetical protein
VKFRIDDVQAWIDDQREPNPGQTPRGR